MTTPTAVPHRRHLLQAGLAASVVIAAPVIARAAPRAAAFDISVVAPELRAALGPLMQFMSLPLSDATLGHYRAMQWPTTPPRADIPVEKLQIPNPSGAPPVTSYLINSRRDRTRPALLFIHGGGYVLGSAGDQIPDLQALSERLDCVILAPDYRLAPESRWKESLNDNYAALEWLSRNAGEVGVNAKRIAVMGESAGGGHAALLCLLARDRRLTVCGQALIYPMLDDRTGSTRAAASGTGETVWTPEMNRYGWRAFLGQEPGSATVPTAAVPARRTDLAGLPPTFIGVGSIDLFVGEDIEYAHRLIDARVSTELHVVAGAYHGFDQAGPDVPSAATFNKAKLSFLRRAFDGMLPA